MERKTTTTKTEVMDETLNELKDSNSYDNPQKLTLLSRLKNNTIVQYLITFLIHILVVMILFNLREPYFATIDDSRMRDIVSGAMTGTPDHHLIFIKTILGYILKFGYTIMPAVPWFMILYVGSMILCFSLAFFRIYKMFSGRFSKIMVIISYCLLFALYLWRLVLYPQFTYIAAAYAMAAFVVIVTIDKLNEKMKLSDLILIVFLIAMSYSFRFTMFQAYIPILILGSGLLLYRNKANLNKKILLNIGITLIVLLTVIFSIKILDQASYTSEEWKEYRKFNNYRAYINDFRKIEPYVGNEEFYESKGMNKSQFNAVRYHMLLLVDDLTKEDLKEIVDYYDDSNQISFVDRVMQGVKKIIPVYSRFTTFKWVPFYIAITSTIVLIMLLFKKMFKESILLFFTMSMAAFGSLFFIVYNRFPQRLAESIWLPLAFILILTFVKLLEKSALNRQAKNKKKTNVPIIIVCVGLLFSCLFSIYRHYLADADYYRDLVIDSDDYVFLDYYSLDNPDNFYFYDVYSFRDASDTFRLDRETELLSFTSIGGWLTRSPLLQEKYAQYGFANAHEALSSNNSYLAVSVNQDLSHLKSASRHYFPGKHWVVDEAVNDGKILLLSLVDDEPDEASKTE